MKPARNTRKQRPNKQRPKKQRPRAKRRAKKRFQTKKKENLTSGKLRRLLYTQEDLNSALNDIKKGCSMYGTAKKYGIPRATLSNKIFGRSPLGKKSGPATILTADEETIIEKWMFGLAVRGFPVTKNQLLYSIQMYLNINKRVTPFPNNVPGRRWYDNFRERHPLISEKISQNLTASRAAITEEKLRNWHSDINKYCERENILDILEDPTRIFNMDEKGFILTPNNEIVLVRRGDKAVYNRSKNDEKECVTALLGGSAAGLATPPMMIHSFKRMPAGILQNNPENWSVGISDSGWQTQVTFFDYITKIFYKFLVDQKIKFPVILFIDGHKSHVSLALSDFCSEKKIELIALYPNSTHLTQPMDVGVFKPLNSSWEKTAKQWRIKEKFAKIERKDIAGILKDAIDGINYTALLKTAFRKSGLYPFNVDNIDFTRILPEVGSEDTPDQLWNGATLGENEVVPKVAVRALQHLETLIGDKVVDLFRLSADIWGGDKEYAALFTIWKKMYRDASTIVNLRSTDADQCQILEGTLVLDGKYL